MTVTPHRIYRDGASMLRPAYGSRPLPLVPIGMSLDGVNIR